MAATQGAAPKRCPKRFLGHDEAAAVWRLLVIEVAEAEASFTYRLDRNKLRKMRRREGRYLLRTNLVEQDPTKLWGTSNNEVV